MRVPQGAFALEREPRRDRSPLRAWDAADEYLLEHVAEIDAAAVAPDGRWVTVNDGFGALAVGLVAAGVAGPVVVWSDSLLAHRAAVANLDRNALPTAAAELVPSTSEPDGPIAAALVKVPRSNALLDSQLRALAPRLAPGAILVGAGMVKHLPRTAKDRFDDVVGPTTLSRSRKKARLLECTVDADRPHLPAVEPTVVEVAGLRLVGLPGVFSSDGLDIGTRVLLDHLPDIAPGSSVVDLGCGTGALGAAAALARPDARVTYIDVSYAAVASARLTHEANGAAASPQFAVADGLEEMPDGSVDLVLCNPPFHQDNARSDAVAWQMFTEARRALRPNGELRIVGNRHLGYHVKLRRIFGNVENVAATRKFVVLSARRPEVSSGRRRG